jgi:hypothetical protein
MPGPPPPPPPGPPPPPPPTAKAPPMSNNLLNDIHKGAKLKKVLSNYIYYNY